MIIDACKPLGCPAHINIVISGDEAETLLNVLTYSTNDYPGEYPEWALQFEKALERAVKQLRK